MNHLPLLVADASTQPAFWPLTAIVFLPALVAAVLSLPIIPKAREEAIRWITLLTTAVVFVLSLWMGWPQLFGAAGPGQFTIGEAAMQAVVKKPWIPAFNIEYLLGVDGISMPLVLLTTFLSMLAAAASWPITKHVKAYHVLFLLLETGMLGVFVSLDFFLFYVFWEVMLLPMYFLIGIWGGPRREYAAIKFFLYTLFGSVLMLLAVLMLYFTSDLRMLSPEQLVAAHVVSPSLDAAGRAEAVKAITSAADPVHTFNILALSQLGQLPKSPFAALTLWGMSLETWAFLLLLVGFVIKVPVVPVHTWLPDAHVEAPTPISMILAGVLLKLGGYGILRICYPICPGAGLTLAWLVCGLGVLSMVYGAFAALAQKDFKRMVAYSSVSHMGYVMLGLGVWSAVAGNEFRWDAWAQGVNGAMFQMLAHGISSAGMFFMVGVLYDRVHHRNLEEFGGIFNRMPVYSGLAVAIFFAGLGLPGLCGFIGEVLVTLSSWNYSRVLAVISAFTVILTAAYILWAIQRVYLGAEYKGPHGDHLTPITGRELAIATPLVLLAIVFGVAPQTLFSYVTPTVNRQVQTLADWTRRVRPDAPGAQRPLTAGATAGAGPPPWPSKHRKHQRKNHVDLGSLLTSTLTDTLSVSLPLFRVELALAATVVLLLLCRMLPVLRHLDSALVALGGVGFALWYAWCDLRGLPGSPWAAAVAAVPARQELFGGLLVFDSLTAYVRLLLAGFLVLYILFTKVSGIPDREDGADFYTMVLGSALGMCMMASANHLLMVFMAVEMASVPSYALAGLLKGRKASSEAALKYAVYGAGAAGVMLYGISLLAGILGTCHVPSMAAEIGRVVGQGAAGPVMVLTLGGLMVAVGLAFKLSAVPFHFWCPDVFEGAAAEVGAFLSVASKAAAVALLIRLAFGLGDPAAAGGAAASIAGLGETRHFTVYLIGLMAAVTCTLGNLAAYGQTNMKRLLAYSTIAHAGYLMMGASAATALLGVSPAAARTAVAALAFYLGTYLFMNLAAFAIVALLRNRLRSEEISSYAGLVRSSPGIVVATVAVLVSLIGLPPMAGFVAKFLVFSSLVEAIGAGAERPLMLVLLVLGGVNTVISLFYYLRVLKVMTFDPPPADRAGEAFPLVSLPGAVVTALAVPVVVLGIFWSGLYACAQLAGRIVS